MRHNHVAGEHVSINYLHYGTDVEIDPGMLEDFYLLQVPLSGAAIVHHRGFEIFADQQTATLLNPDRDTRMHWSGDCRKLLLQIDKSFLDQIAQDLLGHPAPGPVRFIPVVDLQTKSGQHVVRILTQAAYMAGAGSLSDV
ncbi:hypothetical protein [Roseobacter sp.]|uniref:cupin domain-containing protein n=1 Tax=Roseobacter sp. TaxID=1907202 RepID=UPI003858FBC4